MFFLFAKKKKASLSSVLVLIGQLAFSPHKRRVESSSRHGFASQQGGLSSLSLPLSPPTQTNRSEQISLAHARRNLLSKATSLVETGNVGPGISALCACHETRTIMAPPGLAMMLSAAALTVPMTTAFVANPSAGSAFTRQTLGAMRGGSNLW